MYKRIVGLIVLLLVWVVPVQAQGGLVYTRYDVEIEVHEDGRLSVREFQHLRFNGRYTEGFAEIPLDYVNQIRGISVYGGTTLAGIEEYEFIGVGPESYRFEVDDDAIYVDWEYAPTSPGDEMVFMLAYEVEGGLWVYDDMMTMEWRAIAADRGSLSVPKSRVTVKLPFGVTAEQLDAIAFGPEYMTTIEPLAAGQQIIFEATEPIPDGMRFQVVVDFPLGLVTVQKQPWQIAADASRLEYVVDGVAIDIVVEADGRLSITENQEVSVQTGLLDEGVRRLALRFVDEFSNFQLREGDHPFRMVPGECDYCYLVQQSPRQEQWVYYSETSGGVEINESNIGGATVTYDFPALVRGESSTFTLAYEAVGGFSVADDGHLLTWTAVPGEAIMPQEATVTLHLPGGMSLEDTTIEGAVAERSDEGIVLRPEQPLSSWRDWQFTLLLPPHTLNTTQPLWQADFEAVLHEAEARQAENAALAARRQLALRAGGIGVGVTAVLGALVSWYLWGSRKVREVMGNYRTTPPNDLPPGIVAYLLDKEATGRGALASLFYLADLGLIRLNVSQQLTLERLRERSVAAGEKVITPTGTTVEVPGHAAILFNTLMEHLPLGKSVGFTAVQTPFQQALPVVYRAMAEEMVTFFYGRPGQWSWQRLSSSATPFIILAAFMAFNMFVATNAAVSLVVGYAGFFLAATFFIRLIRRQNLQRRTLSRLGEEEVKKWQGFKAYLQDIQKYGDLVEAQEILDRYFAYAVALSMEHSLLKQIEDWGGYAPVWVGNGQLDDGTEWHNQAYDRRLHRRPWYRRGSWLPHKRPILQSTIGPANDRPSLQTISDNLHRSLNEASKNMTGLLNTAVGNGQAQSVTIRAAGQSKNVTWQPGNSINSVVSEIMKESRNINPPRPASSGGSGYRSSGSSGRSSGSRHSSRSSSRSSSSRRSGGGGRRGFK